MEIIVIKIQLVRKRLLRLSVHGGGRDELVTRVGRKGEECEGVTIVTYLQRA